jgi:4-oxalocrotonate tautomerase
VPILSVLVSGEPSPERSSAIAAALTGLTAEILRKDARLTSVAVQYVAPEHWVVGRSSLDTQRKASFFLDVRVTTGTNIREEKARYIAAVFARMSELLGPLHEASYVHVHDVSADAWGYGGRTQAQRRAATAAIAA